jgi:inorganic pyrophosphatase/exopolyphosphatase
VPIRVRRLPPPTTTSDESCPVTTTDSRKCRSVLTSVIGVIAPSGSCSSLITSIFFSHHHTHGPVPRSLSDLLLYTIAIDTKGLKKGTELDQRAVETLFPHSQYADQDHWKVMKRLSKELKKAKKDLDGLTLTQLIQ